MGLQIPILQMSRGVNCGDVKKNITKKRGKDPEKGWIDTGTDKARSASHRVTWFGSGVERGERHGDNPLGFRFACLWLIFLVACFVGLI